MRLKTVLSLTVLLVGTRGLESDDGPLVAPKCRCIPGDTCWPSDATWQAFNQDLGGQLIETHPIAQSCYDGPAKSLEECAFVTKMWSDQDFQTSNPVGRPHPYNITCAPVDFDAGQTPTSCTLGPLPVYAVNATTRTHISSALAFARRHNIRLVVASTGHDILGRSDGYGSLVIWLRHYRNVIDFQKTYTPTQTCCSRSGWDGSAVRIDGAYQWRDVYEVAKANNVIVVGGGAVSPGAIGGWLSGGGHGPATRNYGLGADQILEAEVMLANGSVVVASHCRNTDLFRALRGGGPGYGVVLGTTVKAYPNVDVVTAHKLVVTPTEGTNSSNLLDAVTVLLQSYPALNDVGFAGYAFWSRDPPATSAYSHGFWAIGKTREEAEAGFSPVREALGEFRGSLLVQESFATYGDYWSFYEAESGLYDAVGDTGVLTSRMVDRGAVREYSRVREAVEVFSGRPGESAANVVLLVSGGKVFEGAGDASSGVHPAWRRSPFIVITSRGVSRTVSEEERRAVQEDMTFVKGAAGKKLAPGTGGYMNEGDRHDPEYIETFYGANYAGHLAAKRKYDPTSLFYCPTCVGAEEFVERPDGPLCRV